MVTNVLCSHCRMVFTVEAWLQFSVLCTTLVINCAALLSQCSASITLFKSRVQNCTTVAENYNVSHNNIGFISNCKLYGSERKKCMVTYMHKKLKLLDVDLNSQEQTVDLMQEFVQLFPRISILLMVIQSE